ncbi:FMN-dependent NADH-azoreductase [Actinokineospora enzanensis]|uniref:FMN-dependent NADH-azoreductase n=1 Tax=Actinokineospora enzanensis TaxID=155975 RepID=UPI000367556D|nr:NAD(P)H-dependent oxidoreductase [Actinokineospora enzanensis]
MALLRVDSSIRVTDSVSRALADTVTTSWLDTHPAGDVVRRDLGTDPVPASAWSDSLQAAATPEADRTPDQRAALALAGTVGDEVLAADSVLIATSLYNFGVSQHLKTWIDLLLTHPEFAPGKQPLAGKPVAFTIARGGGYGPGTPREGWDHATPWLVRIFQDVLGGEVTVVAAELTLAEVNPAMAELVPLAKQSAVDAHERAAGTGRALAERTTAAA